MHPMRRKHTFGVLLPAVVTAVTQHNVRPSCCVTGSFDYKSGVPFNTGANATPKQDFSAAVGLLRYSWFLVHVADLHPICHRRRDALEERRGLANDQRFGRGDNSFLLEMLTGTHASGAVSRTKTGIGVR